MAVAVHGGDRLKAVTEQFDEGQVEAFLKVALDAVGQAAKVIKAAMSSRGDLKVSQKSCATDLVTETDKAVEKLLVETIAAKFPDHK